MQSKLENTFNKTSNTFNNYTVMCLPPEKGLTLKCTENIHRRPSRQNDLFVRHLQEKQETIQSLSLKFFAEYRSFVYYLLKLNFYQF